MSHGSKVLRYADVVNVADLIASQRDSNSAWWQDAIRLWWSIASEITPNGFFVVGQPGKDAWVYGVFRIVGTDVEAVTPMTYNRWVAFRRLRKLDRQAR